MITVAIFINGKPVTARTAVNQRTTDGVTEYKVDDGRVVKHRRTDGAVKLAIKLLEGIKEPKGSKCQNEENSPYANN